MKKSIILFLLILIAQVAKSQDFQVNFTFNPFQSNLELDPGPFFFTDPSLELSGVGLSLGTIVPLDNNINLAVELSSYRNAYQEYDPYKYGFSLFGTSDPDKERLTANTKSIGIEIGMQYIGRNGKKYQPGFEISPAMRLYRRTLRTTTKDYAENFETKVETINKNTLAIHVTFIQYYNINNSISLYNKIGFSQKPIQLGISYIIKQQKS